MKHINFHSSPKHHFFESLLNVDCEEINENKNIDLDDMFDNASKYCGIQYDRTNQKHKEGTRVCLKVKKISPKPVVKIKRQLSSSRNIFDPHFFIFTYVDPRKDKKNNEEWNKALKKFGKKEEWITRIQDGFKKMASSPTGKIVLRLLASFYDPREIEITNKNPSRLSANVFTKKLNIPSVPREICYYDPDKNLIKSQLPIALAHECIHLIHKKLGLHNREDSAYEEENTVTGVVDEQYNIDHSLLDIQGRQWKLTENQFRKEINEAIRDNYDSIPICASFEDGGCEIFNKHGEDTCKILQTSQDVNVKKILATLKNRHKHN